jgi:hypothetical protein
MPDEALISQIENLLAEVVALGGLNERTSIVPNLTVQDANPTNLDGFVIVSDDRDGDNILAKKVGSVIYADNDLVNVMFLEGAEAIAFQQGSGSTNNGIWEIVPSTSTDISYSKGDVGIGKSVAPDAALEVLDSSQAQLRLTFQEDTKFADFTLDTNHDLTITPSSTGQIILQPTTDSTDFFQVLDADGGTSILNVDSTNERVGIGTDTPDDKLHISNGKVKITSSANFQNLLLTDTETDATDKFAGINMMHRTNAEEPVGIMLGFADNSENYVDFGGGQITVNAATQLRFFVASNTTTIVGSLAMQINDIGVGMNGVSSPSTALDIGAGAMEFDEMTAPGAGAVNTARLYAVDNGAGKTQLVVIFNTGAVQVLATQP